MIKLSTVVSTLLLSSMLSAQFDSHTVSLQTDFAEQVWYSMDNGVVATADNTDWHIAFLTEGQNSSLIVNSNNATTISLYSEDPADYDSVDLTDFEAEPLHNDETDWKQGALRSLAGSSNFDYGWGEYNIVSHLVEGSKVFVITLEDGSMKKFFIENLNFGTYNFKYADADGSNEVEAAINILDYADKNFIYYSITEDEVIDREPTKDSWDLTFTRYTAEVAPMVTYVVTGVLQNIGVEVAQASGIPIDEADHTTLTFSADKNIIGDDWKFFDQTTFQFVLIEDRSYFVTALDGDIHHMAFTGFGGMATGDIDFQTNTVFTSIEELELLDFSVFPNPTSGTVNISLSETGQATEWTLRSITGATVAADRITDSSMQTIDLNGIKEGMYILELRGEDRLGQQRLLIN